MTRQPTENVYRSKKEMLWNNFLGGIAWGLGLTIGVSLILAFLAFLLRQISFIPIVGNFVISIVHYVQQHG